MLAEHCDKTRLSAMRFDLVVSKGGVTRASDRAPYCKPLSPGESAFGNRGLQIAPFDSCWEHIRAVSTVLRLERAGGGPRSWAGALPIRLVLVSRLRLRQARDLWVFNRNELKTKGLPDGKSRDKNDVRLGV